MARKIKGEVSKEELRDLLNNLRLNFLQYHSRKENLTWLATTVYLGGLLGLASLFIEQGQLVSQSSELECSLIAVVGITCLFTILFVSKQFSDRTFAAHIIASCNEALAQLIDSDFALTRDLQKASKYTEASHISLFPKILINRLTMPDKKHRPLWNYVAPYVVILTWTIALIALILTS